jgi:uncharacterized membrane protein YheB (UPF0754 family)
LNVLLLLGSSIVVGALVGYITNVIAVRMLFHPYRPIRIPLLNVKIQGLLPSKKDEFAERIGEIAEEYLKTEEFKKELESGLSQAIRKAIETELNDNILRHSPFLASLLTPYISRLAEAIANEVVKVLSWGITDEALKEMDIKKLISERIKGLSPNDIEEFYKRFAKSELRMIEYAGLILGAVIGPIEAIIISLIH